MWERGIDFHDPQALELQGFPSRKIEHRDKRFKNAELRCMAGNAMSGFVLAPVFVSIFLRADWKNDMGLEEDVDGGVVSGSEGVEADRQEQNASCSDLEDSSELASSLLSALLIAGKGPKPDLHQETAEGDVPDFLPQHLPRGGVFSRPTLIKQRAGLCQLGARITPCQARPGISSNR